MCFPSGLVAALLGAAVLLIGCGGGSAPASTSASSPVSVKGQTSTGNVLAVVVDAGPNGNAVNQLFATVTICQAGSTTVCQVIDHVLVDTGSTGLRLLSAVLNPDLNLAKLSGTSGLPLLNCAQFIDASYAWGPVAVADVVLGGETASSVPIQIIGDPSYVQVPRQCSMHRRGTAINSVAALGAKGILGIGLFQEDCGSACASSSANGYYYTCNNAACTAPSGTTVALNRQLKNPVALFASDHNGYVVNLPAVASAGASSLSGSLIFGIATQSNNVFASGAVLATDSSGYVTTQIAGSAAFGSSFFDTGSNGLYFDSSTLTSCPAGANGAGFYCPGTTVNATASVVGSNAVSVQVPFAVANGATLLGSSGLTALPGLAGSMGMADAFDWGLPFFYGRRVFVSMEGQTSSLGVGPLIAF